MTILNSHFSGDVGLYIAWTSVSFRDLMGALAKGSTNEPVLIGQEAGSEYAAASGPRLCSWLIGSNGLVRQHA